MCKRHVTASLNDTIIATEDSVGMVSMPFNSDLLNLAGLNHWVLLAELGTLNSLVIKLAAMRLSIPVLATEHLLALALEASETYTFLALEAT